MTAFGQCSYPGRRPVAAPMWAKQDPHVPEQRRRRLPDNPDDYERGRRDGEADREQQQKGGSKFWTWARRAGLVAGATAVLIPAPVLWPVAALVGLGLALPEPASGPVGRRGQTTPAKAETKYERDEFDPLPRKLTADIPESELDGWKEGTR